MTITHIENEKLSMQIYHACQSAGYDDCGIISFEDMNEYILRTKERIHQIPDSSALYQYALHNLEQLQTQFPWARSIIICLSWLGKYRYPQKITGMYAKGFFISRDSDKNGPEYQQKLQLGRWFDKNHIQWTGAIKDRRANIWGLRQAAQAAGIGIIRRNNFLYNEYGSWVELDGFLIDQNCRLYHDKHFQPCPPNCTCCQQACPTAALSAPYTLNPAHCISTITTFAKGVVPKELDEQQIGVWMVGCDACQDACPFNRRHDWSQGRDFPGLEDLIDFMQPENILSADEEELARRICPLTADHILPEDAATLKINAQRVLRNQKAKADRRQD